MLRYRLASRSLSAFKAYVHQPCGKTSFPELQISHGPKTQEKAEFYRRQCCRAPLPDAACPHHAVGAKTKNEKATTCEMCGPCSECGYEHRMHECPIENGEQQDAEYKMYKPRIETDGECSP